MRQRAFIKAVADWCGGMVAFGSAMPVIGFLGTDSPDLYADHLRAFRYGLKEAGYIEGENLAIEYRWAEGHSDNLRALAADLARRQVSVIIALGSSMAAHAALEATIVDAKNRTIPVVFFHGFDPLRGIVASYWPRGNRGSNRGTLNSEILVRRMELLHEAVPGLTTMALLVSYASPSFDERAIVAARQATARSLRLKLHVVEASAELHFDSVFADLTQLQAGGLVIATDSFLVGQTERLAALSAKHAVPAIFHYRPFAAAGGLMSYGPTIGTYSMAGVYTGRILKGEKPPNLPIHQSTKVELVINDKAAKALGLTIPPTLLARADEVIE